MGRRDHESRPLRILGSPAYANRSRNPYNALLSDALVEAGAQVRDFRGGDLLRGWGDVWHLHWPDHLLHRRTALGALWEFCKLVAKLLIAKLRGIRVVWTVHNATPHRVDHPRLQAALQRLLPRALDGWIALSEPARQAALVALPQLAGKPSWVILHGHYRSCYSRPPAREEARRHLDIDRDTRVILFFGLIRAYKNVGGLVHTFRACKGTDLRLVIAGNPEDQLDLDLRRRAEDDQRIRLDLGFIPDEQVPFYFGAADLTVIPFAKILNSGSAVLSLSLDTPVLVPDLGSMRELADLIGAPWVTLFDGKLEADELLAALDAAKHVSGPAPLEPLAWEAVGRQTLEVYQQLVRRSADIIQAGPDDARSAP